VLASTGEDSADLGTYLDFSERVNLEIMRRFEAEGIEFAFPTTTTYLAHDPRRPLKIDVSQHDPPDGKTK